MIDHVCLVCGKHFQTEKNSSKYCGRECQAKGYSMLVEQRKAEGYIYKRRCKMCGKAFETTEVRKYYCSPGCKKEGKNGFAREEYKRARVQKELNEIKAKSKLDSIAVAAKKAGISYGRYMARKEGKI